MSPTNLNTPQRLLLAFAGITIFLIQIYKFDEYGVDGSGWVLAFLVATLLVLPSLSLLKTKVSKTNNGPENNNGQEKFKTFVESSSRVQVAFKRIHAKSEELKKLLIEHIDLPNIPSMPGFNDLMYEDWGRSCFIYVSALSAAVEFKRNPDFLNNDQFVVYAAQVVRETLNSSKQSAIREGLGDKHNDERVKAHLINDFNLAKAAMMQFMDNLASKKQTPDEPLVGFIFMKLGVPDAIKNQIETPLHEFTKKTLRDFASE